MCMKFIFIFTMFYFNLLCCSLWLVYYMVSMFASADYYMVAERCRQKKKISGTPVREYDNMIERWLQFVGNFCVGEENCGRFSHIALQRQTYARYACTFAHCTVSCGHIYIYAWRNMCVSARLIDIAGILRHTMLLWFRQMHMLIIIIVSRANWIVSTF